MKWQRLQRAASPCQAAAHQEVSKWHAPWQQPTFVSTVWGENSDYARKHGKNNHLLPFPHSFARWVFRVCRAQVCHFFSKRNKWLFKIIIIIFFFPVKLDYHIITCCPKEAMARPGNPAVLGNEVSLDTQSADLSLSSSVWEPVNLSLLSQGLQ